MSQRSSRRSFLMTTAAAAVGVSIGGRARRAFADPPPRVGIVGGGLAGVSCAWLLDGVADAVLFERRSSLGGHTETIPVTAGGEEIQVDVGAQFFAPGPHPTYVKLLEILGLLDPALPDEDATAEAEMTITVMATGDAQPLFVSPTKKRAWPVLAPWNRGALFAFLVFALAAKRFTRVGDWLVPVSEWLDGLHVPPEQKDELLRPLLAAMAGCSLDEVQALSARAALVFVGQALPANLLDPFRWLQPHRPRRQHGAAGPGRGQPHFAPGLARDGVCPRANWRLPDPQRAGVCEDVDAVVFAAPPPVTGLSYRPSPESPAPPTCQRFKYFSSGSPSTAIRVHAFKPRFWSAYNATSRRPLRSLDLYGALRHRCQARRPALFKSWATADAPPRTRSSAGPSGIR